MEKIYKTRLHPSREQREEMAKAMEICRCHYNDYLKQGKRMWESEGVLLSPEDFLSGRQNRLPGGLVDSLLHCLSGAEKRMRWSVEHKAPFPRGKKEEEYGSLLFSSSPGPDASIACERHRIFLPPFGWIRLKEKGYIPLSKKTEGRIGRAFLSMAGDGFFLSALYSLDEERRSPSGKERGMWLCLETMTVTREGKKTRLAFTSPCQKKLKASLRRLRRRPAGGMAGTGPGSNERKRKKKVQRLLLRRESARQDALDKTIAGLFREPAAYITLERKRPADSPETDFVPFRQGSCRGGICRKERRLFQKKLMYKCKLLGIPVFMRDTDG